MYSEIKVAEKTASIRVFSGEGPGPHITLLGATFPVVPAGTIVHKLSVKIPSGLHSLAFLCRVDEPQRKGSRGTAYQDHTPVLSTCLLLCWEDNSKLFVKSDREMTAAELAKFNSFVRSDANILVVDTDRKIAYVSNALPRNTIDSTWTYKVVATGAILEYITKKLTMEELDQRVISEQRARDELRELHGRFNRMYDELGRMHKDNESLDKQLAAAVMSRKELIVSLMESEELYKFLKRIPVGFRPKAFDGFVKVMDSIKQSEAS